MTELFFLSKIFGYLGMFLFGFLVVFILRGYLKKISVVWAFVIPVGLALIFSLTNHIFLANYANSVAHMYMKYYPGINESVLNEYVYKEVARFSSAHAEELWFTGIELPFCFAVGGLFSVFITMRFEE